MLFWHEHGWTHTRQYCFCLKDPWNFALTHHGSGHVLKSFVHPFHFFVLLRSIWYGEVVFTVIFVTEGRKVMVFKFFTMINPKLLKHNPLILKLFYKAFKRNEGVTLLYEESYPSKSWVVIHNNHCIASATQTLGSCRTKKIHVRKL